MLSRNFLPFYPRKIAYWGMAVLGAGVIVSVGFLSLLWSDPLSFSLPETSKETQAVAEPLMFSFELESKPVSIPLPHISQELIFSFDSPRPDELSAPLSVLVKLKKTQQSKRVILPGRVDFEFLEEKLRFSDGLSSFWMEIDSSGLKKIEGKVFIETPLSEKMEAENFSALPQEITLQTPQDFSEGSPFRFLSEGKWWGADRFREKYENGEVYQRVEVGSKGPLIDLHEGDWLIWDSSRWVKGSLNEGIHRPIARFKSVQGKALVFEGWEGNQYVCFSLNLVNVFPLKMKLEELFNSIRVRSAKQISCMLEKQWLILKAGDWVLKSDGKWKILKKKEERELYWSGNIGGDLFVFEKIESKQGQKWIQGQFFSADRSQSLFIDFPVPAHGIRKGKNEADVRKGGATR